MLNDPEYQGALYLEGDVDHINPEKFTFRREALAQDRRRGKIIELYAGVGYLTFRVYAPAYREVVVVEKNPSTSGVSCCASAASPTFVITIR